MDLANAVSNAQILVLENLHLKRSYAYASKVDDFKPGVMHYAFCKAFPS